ncbi:MAG: hypothetical protein WCV90_07275 [Candidatus Woesearchaeota archaeon]
MFDSNYYSESLKRITTLAGARYQSNTNIELPIMQHFDFFTRNSIFYTDIRSLYGNLSRSLDNFTLSKEVKYERYTDFIFQKKLLLKRLKKVFPYNSQIIPWNIISTHLRFIKFYLNQYSHLLRDYILKNSEINTSLKNEIESKQHFLREADRYLESLYNISSGLNGSLSNSKLLLISGGAGNGKTHLLVDVYQRRISGEVKQPTLFLFGEQFSSKENIWTQVINQSKLPFKNHKELLDELSVRSFEGNTNGLIIIDALNESEPHLWKENLRTIINDIKGYPNVSLVISVRNGYQEEVFDTNIKEQFIEIEHHGYSQDILWDVTEKYFEYYNITYPDFPLLNPEFQNPLFLLFFCKANKNSKLPARQENGNWLKSLFERYVIDEGHEKVLKKLNPSSVKKYGEENILWSGIIKKGIAPWMIFNNTSTIDEENLKKIVEKYLPDYNVDQVIKLLENGNILNSYCYSKIKYFKLPFDKFSNHIIVRTLLENIPKKDRIDSFKENNPVGKFILANKYNFGILEALCIQTPEFCDKELYKLTPYLEKNRLLWDAFTESIIWRNPNKISPDLILLIRNNLELRKDFLLKPLLNLAHIAKHPLNADFLCPILKKQNMVERDSWWSIFLHNNYEEEGEIVNRIISWSISHNQKQKISSEVIRLYSITLAWFLTSSNRSIRDKATKGLINLLKDHLIILKYLLNYFKDTNDLYVLERLYCVTYGCCLLNPSDSENVKEIALQVYKNIFENNTPPSHILLRDYARGIIETAINNGISLGINEDNINPPYKSQFPEKLPSDEDIKRYELDYHSKDVYFSQNKIISSMQPEHTTLHGNMYGDFGRYVFQSALSNWDVSKSKITMQQLSNLSVKIIFEDLKYDVNLLGEFDRNLDRYSTFNRSERDIERFGKKYQWISFHIVASLVADNFKFKPLLLDTESTEIYRGAWSPHIRDIDPSISINSIRLQKKPEFKNFQKYIDTYDIMKDDFSKWIVSSGDLLDFEKWLDFKDDSNLFWMNLGGSYDWYEETLPEEKEYENSKRGLRIWFESYLVKKEESKILFNSIKEKSFWGDWMPKGTTSYEFFLGEYPHFKACQDTIRNYDCWTDISSFGKNLSAKVLPTYVTYSTESSLDYSINGGFSIKLPNKEIIDKMNLKCNSKGQSFFEDELVFFDNSITETGFPNGIIANKKKLLEFLNKNNFVLFWKVMIEKTIIGGNKNLQDFKPKEISLLVIMKDNGTLDLVSKVEK